MQVRDLDYYTEKINASDPLRPVLVFAIKLALIYILWRVFTIIVGAEAQPIDTRIWPWLSIHWQHANNVLKAILTYCSLKVLLVLGYKAYMEGNDLLQVVGYGGVGIGNYCLAVELMVLFVALIISYPATLLNKLWFVPVGLILIQIVNVFRIVGLCLLKVHSPNYMEFNHHYTFRFIVFVFILALYYWFIKRYGNPSDQASQPVKEH